MREKLPDLCEDLLKHICYEAEITCLIQDNNENIPVWSPEITSFHEFGPKWGHPITHEVVPPIFIIQFLQRSLLIPQKQAAKDKSFIAPIILWEFSRDSYHMAKKSEAGR